jgi:sterol desaturase/sphingolipid hydroxylase (fatty acid hydroxylase superfamily)
VLWIILIGAQLISGALMGALLLAYAHPRFAAYKIAEKPHRAVSDKRLYQAVGINMIVPPALIFTVCGVFRDTLFYEGSTPVWLMVVECAMATLIYDFAYYFFHRYPMHEWKVLRSQHALHHAARNPTALDSLMVHPIEMVGGLLLFFGSIAAVGGIHLHAFAVAFLGFTTLNVFNHAGLNVPLGPLKIIGRLSVKHDRHHHSMLCGNYAAITPLPDMVFGTVE